MTDPQSALPLCHSCQGPMSRGLYEMAQWTCMRCWGGWLAGAPEPEPAAEPTRSQKLAAAGFTRRPTWRSLPSDGE